MNTCWASTSQIAVDDADPVGQPLLLLLAEHRLFGRERQFVIAELDGVAERLDERRPALLVGAVLTGVEHVEPQQVAVGERAVDRVVGAAGWVEPHGHVLVPDLIAGGATGEERLALGVFLAAGSCVVVVDLVVVPRDDPRHERMGGLQQRIALIQGVALAVLIDRLALEILAGRAAAIVGITPAGVLVDVIAEEHEGVDAPLLDEVAVCGEVALLPVLAGREREPELIGCRAGGGEGVGPCRSRLEVADAETVVVLRVGLEPPHVDVDRMPEGGDR